MLPGGGDSVLRQRRLRPSEAVKALDAFPKTAEEVKEQTSSGGGVSVIVFIIIAVLVVLEFRYYASTEMRYSYNVDADYHRKIRLNVDITLGATCETIGADVVDSAESSSVAAEEHIQEEPVSFTMSPSEPMEWEIVAQMAEYVRREHHALHEIFWREGFSQRQATEYLRNVKHAQGDDHPKDGCRIHGYYLLNKISGNLHIIGGKSMNVFPFGHAHMQVMMPLPGGGILIGGAPAAVNFSHRISHLSFGTPVPGLIHPLDGDQKIASSHNVMYQYMIKVIPTDVDTLHAPNTHTYQMAVTENERVIDHHEGSHGVPGIFIKYDFSPLAVKIEEYHKPYWQFIVRLCGIIGGVFATSGFLHFVVSFFVDSMLCRWGYSQKQLSSGLPINGGVHHLNGVAN